MFWQAVSVISYLVCTQRSSRELMSVSMHVRVPSTTRAFHTPSPISGVTIGLSLIESFLRPAKRRLRIITGYLVCSDNELSDVA